MAAKTPAKRKPKSDVLDRARLLLDAPLDIDAMLLKLGVREQSAQARRLATCEQTNPKRAQAFRRLAALLFSLASSRPRMVQRAIQFYIPDGKYQLQVFALDDATDGTLVVCCEDMLAAAIEADLLTPLAGQAQRYTVLGTSQALTVEQQDGKTENPPVYCGAMTGWNRRALKVTLPSDPSSDQLQCVELLCAMSSLRWQAAVAAAAAQV